jgi:hypothetical protein
MSDEFKGLNLVELLDLLEPIPEPAPVSLWPQTAGWLWLAVFVLIGLLFAVWRLVRAWRARAYRRQALTEIAASGHDPAKIAEILRRTALSAFARTEVASLHGADWLHFLDQTYGGTGFSQGPGRVLASAPYRPTSSESGLVALAQEWIKRHRPPRVKSA